MANIWITTDWHLIHMPDGFNCYVKARNYQTLMDKIHRDVANSDMLIVLGDIAHRDNDYIVNGKVHSDLALFGDDIRNLPGYKILVKGNHDGLPDSEYHKLGFYAVCDGAEFDDIIFTHKPYRIDPNDKLTINIHGHDHTKKYSNLDGQHILVPPVENSEDPPVMKIEDVLTMGAQYKDTIPTTNHSERFENRLNHFINLRVIFDEVNSRMVSENVIRPACMPTLSDVYLKRAYKELAKNMGYTEDEAAGFALVNTDVMTESATESTIFKTPEELSKWMKSNIRYKNFTKLMTPDEVYKTRQGSCHDQVWFEYYHLKKLGVSPKILFFIEYSNDSDQGGMTHTLVYYTKHNKTFWFENAWGGQEGIHEFDSISSLKSHIIELHKKMPSYQKFSELEFKSVSIGKFKEGISLGELVNDILNESANITELQVKVKHTTNPNDEVSDKAVHLSFYDGKNKVGEVCVSAVDTDQGFVYDLEVFEKYRRMGYGTRIMRYVLNHYEIDGLSVDPSNHAAIDMYKKLGFKMDKKFKDPSDNKMRYWMSYKQKSDLNETVATVNPMTQKEKENLATKHGLRVPGSSVGYNNEIKSDKKKTDKKNEEISITPAHDWNLKDQAKSILIYDPMSHMRGPNSSVSPADIMLGQYLDKNIDSIGESTNTSSMYHLSTTNLNNKTLTPRIPKNYLIDNGFEDKTTKRVCFSPSIDKSLRAFSSNLSGKVLYVHIPDQECEVYKPSVKEVPDVKITGEMWVKESVKLKCIGKIKVIKSSDGPGYSYYYGLPRGKTYEAELFDWEWDWIEKYDTVIESALSTNQKLYPVYVMLMHTGTVFSNVIKTFTHDPFSHSSISFDPSMTNMYSFGRKTDTTNCFRSENIKNNFFRNKNIQYTLYCVPVTKPEMTKMKARLDHFVKNVTKFKYDTSGLVKNFFGISDNPQDRWFCSRFVADILNSGRDKDHQLINDPSMVRPTDFMKMPFVHYVTGGILDFYDEKVVKYVTKRILKEEHLRRKSEADMEGKSITETVYDIDFTNPYAIPTLQYQLSGLDEAAFDNVRRLISSFKIRFNRDGSVIITQKEYRDLRQHFNNSQKMLKVYSQANNIEGLKSELARIYYMITLIEKYYMNNPTADKAVMKDMVDLRSVMLNVMRQTMSTITKADPNFDFQQYYATTKYSEDINLPKNVVRTIDKTLITLLT